MPERKRDQRVSKMPFSQRLKKNQKKKYQKKNAQSDLFIILLCILLARLLPAILSVLLPPCPKSTMTVCAYTNICIHTCILERNRTDDSRNTVDVGCSTFALRSLLAYLGLTLSIVNSNHTVIYSYVQSVHFEPPFVLGGESRFLMLMMHTIKKRSLGLSYSCRQTHCNPHRV